MISRDDRATAAPPRSRGPYAKTRKVRESIIEAAVEVFAATGYHAAAMKEIAQRAGLSEGGLAHHFTSKTDLLFEILERREARAGTQITRLTGIVMLLAMVDIVAEDNRTPGMVELHTTLAAEATSPGHPSHEHYLKRYANVRLVVRNAFETLAEAGVLDTTLTPAELAASFVALSDGLQLQWLYHPDEVNPVATLSAFLRSVAPRVAPSS
ncbi:TetR/AcrR family transcriptional regulator [Actinoplanes derwentensis]|uniref:DNA-binding transcriptional regulator, AcrR family n=1 Tax=Actinoplanes derwentensis TaxID=113562 RepID=A0A1H1QWV8_9ACTN|nr:TetR/AcrR family transcriptional regulator [Actinoplanes derwentensis]GID87085.1 TetR family transcriptional regulator [Actinoplanes derwentensis]SDS27853.1 DNA-binding transcriptional regulator, AcrR family [Actinoplanes derwentensis]